MTRQLGMFTLIVCLVAACIPAHDASRENTDRAELAKQMWERNMTIVDRSIAVWKASPGTGAYTPKELESAIVFFQTVTRINYAHGNFLGPIPDDELQKTSDAWKAWYLIHGKELTYDRSKRKVVLGHKGRLSRVMARH